MLLTDPRPSVLRRYLVVCVCVFMYVRMYVCVCVCVSLLGVLTEKQTDARQLLFDSRYFTRSCSKFCLKTALLIREYASSKMYRHSKDCGAVGIVFG